jgi:hypothetical protein
MQVAVDVAVLCEKKRQETHHNSQIFLMAVILQEGP